MFRLARLPKSNHIHNTLDILSPTIYRLHDQHLLWLYFLGPPHHRTFDPTPIYKMTWSQYIKPDGRSANMTRAAQQCIWIYLPTKVKSNIEVNTASSHSDFTHTERQTEIERGESSHAFASGSHYTIDRSMSRHSEYMRGVPHSSILGGCWSHFDDDHALTFRPSSKSSAASAISRIVTRFLATFFFERRAEALGLAFGTPAI